MDWMSSVIKPYLYWILILFLMVGIYYPAIGLLALICMLAPVALAPAKGRFWCGNYCPRGSLYDQIISRYSLKKKAPAIFAITGFRAFMVAFIMTIFSVQMSHAWGNWAEMGWVFVQIILVTTLVGIGLGWAYQPRTWCTICPMGTLANWSSQRSAPMPIQVDESCVNCSLCVKACPLQLEPYQGKDNEKGFSHGDCLKCNRCIEKCPKQALRFS